MKNTSKMTKQQVAILIGAMAKDELIDAVVRDAGSAVTVRLDNGQLFYIQVTEVLV